MQVTREDIESFNRIYERCKEFALVDMTKKRLTREGFIGINNVYIEGNAVWFEYSWQDPLYYNTDLKYYDYEISISMETFLNYIDNES